MAETLDQLTAQLRAAAGGELRKYLMATLTRASLVGEGAARLAATTRLRVRTGRLRSSITHSVTESPQGLELRLHAGGGRKPVAYAGMQEHGGTVRPRRGQYLTVPLPGALTAAGALRARFAVPGGLRMVPGLFVIRSGAGNLLVVEKRGAGIRPLFVLKHSVSVRGKGFLATGAAEAVRALPEMLRKSIVRVVTP